MPTFGPEEWKLKVSKINTPHESAIYALAYFSNSQSNSWLCHEETRLWNQPWVQYFWPRHESTCSTSPSPWTASFPLLPWWRITAWSCSPVFTFGPSSSHQGWKERHQHWSWCFCMVSGCSFFWSPSIFASWLNVHWGQQELSRDRQGLAMLWNYHKTPPLHQ